MATASTKTPALLLLAGGHGSASYHRRPSSPLGLGDECHVKKIVAKNYN